MSVTAEQYREFRERGGVIDIASRAIFMVTGADRVRYINGQVSANITAAKESSVLPACVTTAKGKLSADVFVGVWPGAILVDADSAVRESLRARLERYVVADDVQIEDVTDRAALVHCVGVEPKRMDQILGEVPGAGSWPLNRFGSTGMDFFPRWRTQLAPLWDHLTAHLTVLSEDLIELVRIEGGVPRWGFELDENTLPAEAGLDRTHVDFKKGCYIGQEVISRVKSVGHVNRELRGFVADAPLARGARLFTADTPEKEHGTITSTAFSFALDRPIALGYLRRGSPQTGLVASSADAPDAPVPVSLHPLPFIQ
jgi:tRNA-modifying protein YgfZ